MHRWNILIRKCLYFQETIMYYLGANHRKKDLNKVIKNRLQNLNEEQQKYLLIFLQNPE